MSRKTIASLAATAAVLLTLSGCANMSRQDKGTVAGAAIGGVAGSVLTGGDALGTVGGAAVGGIVGRETQRRR